MTVLSLPIRCVLVFGGFMETGSNEYISKVRGMIRWEVKELGIEWRRGWVRGCYNRIF